MNIMRHPFAIYFRKMYRRNIQETELSESDNRWPDGLARCPAAGVGLYRDGRRLLQRVVLAFEPSCQRRVSDVSVTCQ